MTLAPGTRLGPYEIAAPLGAGGMGEVYRATDTHLKRSVAIKVLPASMASDADRLMRFQREAEALAALNHPNIAAIYGLEKTPELTALVMELVEGQDLSEMMGSSEAGPSGPANSPGLTIRPPSGMSISDALPIAKQIADALEAAHEAGIVHRDLKPQNIKVRADGTVKVLDFGLAKATDANVGPGAAKATPYESPTMTSPAMTAMGMILGTAAYMSPEQAKGRAVDKRADIWAFGVVLYEMLSGKRAFDPTGASGSPRASSSGEGDSVIEILSAVLSKDVDLTALPSGTPPAIVTLIRRCLVRDPKKRLRDIGEARLLLEDPAALDTAGPSPSQATAPSASFLRRALPWAIAAALAVMLAVSQMFTSAPPPTGTPLRRFTIEIPSKSAPNWNDFDVAVSPDGTQVAYNCREGNTVNLCVRALDSLTARPVSEGRDALSWFYSPSGEWLGMVDAVGLSKVSVRGGKPQEILRWADTEGPGQGFAWAGDDHILFGTNDGIQRVSASGGGARERVTKVAAGSGVAGHGYPWLLPGGQSALITIAHADGRRTGGIVNLSDGSVRELPIRGQGFFYMPQGWLAFRQGTTVLAAAFDPRNPERVGNPVPVLENVGVVHGVARDGTLVYIPTRGESSARLVWVDRQGRPTPVAGERLDYTHLDLAPDGRRALLNLEGGSIDLIDLETGTRKLLASGGFPIWSADGKRATFNGSGGLQWVPADGSAPAEIVVPRDRLSVPTSWNAATGELAYYDHRAYEIWIRSTDGKIRKFLGGPGRKRSGRFSPDGKWMAFVSDETGDYQVYVTAYPGPGATVTVSTKGGLSPIWSADGRELFYRLGGKMLAASLSSTAPLGFSVPVELFDGPYTLDLKGHQREAVARDGRFLMVENSDDFPIVIVQNWAAELTQMLSVRK